MAWFYPVELYGFFSTSYDGVLDNLVEANKIWLEIWKLSSNDFYFLELD